MAFTSSVVYQPSCSGGPARLLCCQPRCGAHASAFKWHPLAVNASGARSLLASSQPSRPAGASLWTARGKGRAVVARVVMAAPHQPPAADGESGESQKPDLMELNRDQLMACSSCSSFAELVGAVGPVRSAGTDLEWASALAGNPGTPPLIVDTTEEERKVMQTLMEVVGGAKGSRGGHHARWLTLTPRPTLLGQPLAPSRWLAPARPSLFRLPKPRLHHQSPPAEVPAPSTTWHVNDRVGRE